MEGWIGEFSDNMSAHKKLLKFIRKPLIWNIVLWLSFLLFWQGSTSFFNQTQYHLPEFITLVLLILASMSLVTFIVRLVQYSFQRMVTAKKMYILIISYILCVIAILAFLSFAYNLAERFEIGYLTYNICSEVFSPEKMFADPLRTEEHFYFTGVTFFLLGYGDICPMGASKYLSLITALFGSFFNVVLMGMVVYYYITGREEVLTKRLNKKKKKK